jgi:hypothetical protein
MSLSLAPTLGADGGKKKEMSPSRCRNRGDEVRTRSTVAATWAPFPWARGDGVFRFGEQRLVCLRFVWALIMHACMGLVREWCHLFPCCVKPTTTVVLPRCVSTDRKALLRQHLLRVSSAQVALLHALFFSDCICHSNHDQGSVKMRLPTVQSSF